MSLHIFLLYFFYNLCFTCINFYDLYAWGGCWFVDYIRRFIYKFLNLCPFDYTAVAGSGKVGPVNQVNNTSWVTVDIPTGRPKSVCNRCVIELFLWRCLCCHFTLISFLLVFGFLSYDWVRSLPFSLYVSNKQIYSYNRIIVNITSPEHLIFTYYTSVRDSSNYSVKMYE